MYKLKESKESTESRELKKRKLASNIIDNTHSFFMSSNIYRFVKANVGSVIENHDSFMCFDVELRVQVSVFAPDTRIKCIELYKESKRMLLFQHSRSVTPVETIVFFKANSMQLTPEMIRNEITALISRGHSLFEKKCLCKTDYMQDYRIRDIGVSRRIRDDCTLIKFNVGCTEEDISRELGISSIHKATIDSVTIHDILTDSGLFCLRAGILGLQHDELVDNRDKLLQAIKNYKFGININNPMIQYKNLLYDIDILSGNNKIIVLSDEDDKNSAKLFYLYTKQQKVDDDIVDLWNRAGDDAMLDDV